MIYFCKHSNQTFQIKGNRLLSDANLIEFKTIYDVNVPVFKAQATGVNEFSVQNAIDLHKNAMQWLHETHKTTETSLRERLVQEMSREKNVEQNKILITGAGEGNDLPYLFRHFPNSIFYVQDIAEEMLSEAISRTKHFPDVHELNFWLGDACDLPFRNDTFDFVYHFGGINLFSSPTLGVSEMHRVAKVNGTVLFGDEGIAPFLRRTELGKALIRNNPLYDSCPPIESIPLHVTDFRLQYLFNNCFYLVTFRKANQSGIDIDVQHKGYRGGSIRTRYFGQLEGVDPHLRERLYRMAKERGLSRSELIEKFLHQGISNYENNSN
jgi:ubiquinone/menaquinone biosynthesis C-methylase UbiE